MSAADAQAATLQLYERIASHLPIGGQARLPSVQTAHFWTPDTPLAACLLTLGIPYRDPDPCTHHTTERGGTSTLFWFGDGSGPPGEHVTEQISSGWNERAKFEAKFPVHPLVWMRAAIDARQAWLEVLHGRARLPAEAPAGAFVTGSLNEASVLRASGFRPLAFTGRAWALVATHENVPAPAVLAMAAQVEGATPPQWMHRVIVNLNACIAVTRRADRRLLIEHDGRTINLSADAPRALRDQFLNL